MKLYIVFLMLYVFLTVPYDIFWHSVVNSKFIFYEHALPTSVCAFFTFAHLMCFMLVYYVLHDALRLFIKYQRFVMFYVYCVVLFMSKIHMMIYFGQECFRLCVKTKKWQLTFCYNHKYFKIDNIRRKAE